MHCGDRCHGSSTMLRMIAKPLLTLPRPWRVDSSSPSGATRSGRISIRRTLLAFAGLLAADGCAIDEPPVLSDFALSSSELVPGRTTTATALVEDDDGDLYGGRTVVTIRSGSDRASREQAIDYGGATGKVTLTLTLRVNETAPKGPATVDVQVFDEAGHGSNVVTAPVTIK